MKKLLLTLLILPLLSIAEEPGRWVELFNGKNLEGWTQRGGVAKYHVEDGVIVGTTVPKTPNSFLCSDKDYGNFILEVEYKVDPNLNCGIQFRSLSTPDYKDGRVHGYQAEIDPSDRGWSAGIYDESRNGWIGDLSKNPEARYAFKQNDWNHYRIEAVGNHLVTFINGVRAADITDDTTAKGFIALQVHGIGSNPDIMQVRYRNIRIQDLGETDYKTPAAEVYTHEGPLVKEGAEFRKLAGDFKFTEGPALSPDGKIFFNDIPNERTHIFDPESGETTIFREPSGRANGLFFTPAGALISCEGGNRKVTRTDYAGKVTVLADKYDGKKLNSPNDVVPDGIGGFYFSDPRYGNEDDMELDVQAVYYLDRKGKITQVASDLPKPNGVILSPDGETLYVADTSAEKIFAYDVTAPGKIENKREFADTGSDGMSVDKLGNIYITQVDIVAFAPDGKEVLRLTPPEKPANCLLTGKTLYVTARTGFYAIDLEVEGVQ
ncbi:MAG: DUF1080 domain-containing protein [Verrucomicrobiales bacterium]|nr:DUF1080 domain-containing protein [Verrucomicrobiales bacterium]